MLSEVFTIEKGISVVARNRIGVNTVLRILGRTVITIFEMKTFNLLVWHVTQECLCITSKVLCLFSNNS